jgi:hypothetical protein
LEQYKGKKSYQCPIYIKRISAFERLKREKQAVTTLIFKPKIKKEGENQYH